MTLTISEAMLSEVNHYQYFHKDFSQFYHTINMLFRKEESSSIHNVLITQFGSLNNALLLAPFIRELSKLIPDRANIYLVVPEKHKIIFEKYPNIRVLPFEPDTTSIFITLKSIIKFCSNTLYNRQIDIAFAPMWNPPVEALLLNWLSGATIRVGYGKYLKNMFIHEREQYIKIFGTDFDLNSHLLTDLIPNSHKQELDRKLFVLEKYFKTKITDKTLDLFYTPVRLPQCCNTIHNRSIVVGLSSNINNQKLAAVIRQMPNYKFYVVNDDDCIINLEKCDLHNKKNVINLVNRITFAETIELIKHAGMYIGDNTYLVQIAKIFNKPCIIFRKDILNLSHKKINNKKKKLAASTTINKIIYVNATNSFCNETTNSPSKGNKVSDRYIINTIKKIIN